MSGGIECVYLLSVYKHAGARNCKYTGGREKEKLRAKNGKSKRYKVTIKQIMLRSGFHSFLGKLSQLLFS